MRPFTVRGCFRAAVVIGLGATIACLQTATVRGNVQAGADQSVSNQFVSIQASLPSKVIVGESFQYQIEVTNVSDNTTLRDVQIEQAENDGISIESAKIRTSEEQSQQRKQAGSSEQQEDQQQSSQPRESRSGRKWSIEELGPGESRTIQITASSDKEGQLKACLAVTSYTPVLCLSTDSVKPELELVKQAPEQSDLCDELEWEYFVKNTGSGDPGEFIIQDELPEGLQTQSGDKQLKFQVDGVQPGETRKFVAKLRATQPGDYRSAAVAIRGQHNHKSKSNEAGTKVVQADLAVAIEGPRTRYVNRLVDYTVRVTNHGKGVAENARLTLHYPGELQLANASQPRPSDQQAPKNQADSSSQQAAAKESQASQRPKEAQDRPKEARQQEQQDASQGGSGQQQQDPPSPPVKEDSPKDQQDPQQQQQPAAQQDATQEDEPRKQEAKKEQQEQDPQQQQQQEQEAEEQGQQRQQKSRGDDPSQGDDQKQGQTGGDDPAAESHTLQPSEAASWELGTLQPGGSMEVSFAVRGSRQGEAHFKAEATYVCDAAQDGKDVASTATMTTQLIALPALMVAVVDNLDPAPVAQQVRYTIIVGNEGEAPDHDVQVSVELPDQLKFIEASGETQVEADGQKLTFQRVEELRPGQRARWDVTTEVTGEGDVRFHVEVTSKYLRRPTVVQEPTNLFSPDQPASQAAKSQSTPSESRKE